VAWLALRIQERADIELHDESSIRAALLELEESRATGELSSEEIEAAEDLLIERLLGIRGVVHEEGRRP
jgi:hypothetical protein